MLKTTKKIMKKQASFWLVFFIFCLAIPNVAFANTIQITTSAINPVGSSGSSSSLSCSNGIKVSMLSETKVCYKERQNVCKSCITCTPQELVGTVNVSKAGYYKITALSYFDSGDNQVNESYYLTVENSNGDLKNATDGNYGEYYIIKDAGGLASKKTEYAGAYYFSTGINKIYSNHASLIVPDNELNQPISPASESVAVLGLCLVAKKSVPEPDPEPAGGGLISIHFDDGLLSTYKLAASVMKEYGFKGVSYVYTKAQNDQYTSGFMSWDEVVNLQNNYNWEIGSHTYSHGDLTKMSLNKVKQELSQSKQDFNNHGINVKSFASPYGAYNKQIIEEVAKLYGSHRTAWGISNTWPVDDYELKAKSVSANTSLATVKQWIDQAKQNNEWLILLFHEVTESDAQAGTWEYNLDNFENILLYIKLKNIPVATTSEGLEKWASGANLIANGSFEQGSGEDAESWVRSDASNVKILNNNSGSYPESLRSAYIKGGSDSNVISSYGINIDSNKDYGIKAFCKVDNYISGDASVWISEFDDNYGYTGGKWLGGIKYDYAGTRYFDYTPNSEAKIAEVFFFTHPGANMTLGIDNIEFREK